MVAAYNGNRWERLCAVLGHGEWVQDPRFDSSGNRVKHRALMQAMLDSVFVTRPTTHWLEALRKADILCAKVADYSDLLVHPQLADNALLASIEHPRHGTLRTVGFPVNSAAAAAEPYRPAPDLGEHSRSVLRDFAFSDEEIDRYLQGGAVRESREPKAPR